MVYRHYRLPSLTALAAFEASARHRSIQRAADELNVTAGAVSRQVKALEEDSGRRCSCARRAGLALTADGEALYAVLAHSFSRTAETVQIIRSGNRTKRVTLACTHAFATQWLMPRMGDFWRRFPEVIVDHLISDDAREFRRAEVDLRIRYGIGGVAGRSLGAADDRDDLSDRRGRVRPAARRVLRNGHPGPAAAAHGLDGRRLDGLGRAAAPRRDPARGARPAGASARSRSCCRPARRTRASPSAGIGWSVPWSRRGRLVRFTELPIPAPGSYYLSWNANRETGDAVATLREWLLAAAQDAEGCKRLRRLSFPQPPRIFCSPGSPWLSGWYMRRIASRRAAPGRRGEEAIAMLKDADVPGAARQPQGEALAAAPVLHRRRYLPAGPGAYLLPQLALRRAGLRDPEGGNYVPTRWVSTRSSSSAATTR